MISFYPGPSRVHDAIPEYVKDAFEKGLLSINHRSNEFMEISEGVITLLKNRLEIPDDYTVFYTSSATECWEIIAQSIIKRDSLHIYNGAFGKKWYEYTRRIRPEAAAYPFGHNDTIDVDHLKPVSADTVICLTQNETSNGTQVANMLIRTLKTLFPGNLIAVDATSSMAGIYLDFEAADIWFASVQKCFGLPAGLGLMICSPAAMQRVAQLSENDHYNSLVFMAEMMKKWQTPYTPNVLNIYLLYRVLGVSKPIREVHEITARRYRQWAELLNTKKELHHLVENAPVHSLTVIPVKAEEALVSAIKSEARKNGLLLGEGYGDLKSSTFRIANFPAIKVSEITKLKKFLAQYD